MSDTVKIEVNIKQHVLKSDIEDIDVFVMGYGPGAFTSLRVGLATLKGLVAISGKPIVAVSSLDAIAMNVKEDVADIVGI